VIVKLSDSQISFTIGDSLLCSKLIEGNYPNYRQVIPGDSNERVVIGREALLETVRRVSLLSSDKSNSVKLVFSENRIEVTANSPDVGEAQESMDVIYQGPPMQIAFNPEFLQAPLRALDTDDVYLDLIDEMSPGVLRIEGTFLYVLMPMRVTNCEVKRSFPSSSHCRLHSWMSQRPLMFFRKRTLSFTPSSLQKPASSAASGAGDGLRAIRCP
jgi:DNA polymerase III subunit beta